LRGHRAGWHIFKISPQIQSNYLNWFAAWFRGLGGSLKRKTEVKISLHITMKV
jgi:hypothetical protein